MCLEKMQLLLLPGNLPGFISGATKAEVVLSRNWGSFQGYSSLNYNGMGCPRMGIIRMEFIFKWILEGGGKRDTFDCFCFNLAWACAFWKFSFWCGQFCLCLKFHLILNEPGSKIFDLEKTAVKKYRHRLVKDLDGHIEKQSRFKAHLVSSRKRHFLKGQILQKAERL